VAKAFDIGVHIPIIIDAREDVFGTLIGEMKGVEIGIAILLDAKVGAQFVFHEWIKLHVAVERGASNI
jgi:hypothetical protein